MQENFSVIIGTAGHIDHGKTTLIKRLTGVDLDSSPEEKERGITISLGFTSLNLDTQQISIIDVPGHEKLVRTMISGASSVHAVMLCISAMDSVMPQTKEHVQILDVLGVEKGIIVITMCDLVGEEELEIIREEIQDLVVGTFLESAAIVQTSAIDPDDHTSGIQTLRAEINALLPYFTQNTDTNYWKHFQHHLPFRLPIDRVFVQKGFGAVVTGTSKGRNITEGASIQIHPQNIVAKVRDIQSHNKHVSTIGPEYRIALNLSGISHHDIQRGSVVTLPNTIPMTSMVDIEYKHIPGAPTIASGTRVRLLFGSTEIFAVLHLYRGEELEPNQEYLVQLRLEQPHILCRGDRCILRRESPLQTLGGGMVLDPYSVKLKKKNQEEQEHILEDIRSWHKEHAHRAFHEISAHHHEELRQLFLQRHKEQGMDKQQASVLGVNLHTGLLAERVYSTNTIDDCLHTLGVTLWTAHQQQPFKKGFSAQEIQHKALPFLGKMAFDELLRIAMERNILFSKNGVLHHTEYQIKISVETQKEIDKLLHKIECCNTEGYPISTFPSDTKPLVQYLLDTQQIIRIDTQVIHPTQLDNLLHKLQLFFANHTEMTTSDFKEISGLSRKFSIPFLEWLDQQGKTIRQENNRIKGHHL